MAPPAIIGVILAIASGLFIGTSFVLKKVGLLKANEKYNEAAGEGYGYLKNKYWWGGMTLMIIGELCNFVAYAFADAILVTPMGALSVVVTAILSAIFLNERLSFIGMAACFICINGSVMIAINAPGQTTVTNIEQMKDYVVAPGFLTYAGIVIAGAIFIAFWVGPRYGNKTMFVYLTVCSTIGGLSVVATQGLGAAIVAQAGGTPQFNQWFLYIVLVFVVCTLLTEIVYLNKALNIYNTALVTPTYYVYFTSCTLITSVILFRGIKGTTRTEIASIVLGFLEICAGSLLLQLSKSAKDVPDSKVLTAGLGQLQAVAEQEEAESEPRADTIRGTAAIIRSLSRARQMKEVREVERMHEETLEPIGENEAVEWDGVRRRKTVSRSLRDPEGGPRHRIARKPAPILSPSMLDAESKEGAYLTSQAVPPTPPPHHLSHSQSQPQSQFSSIYNQPTAYDRLNYSNLNSTHAPPNSTTSPFYHSTLSPTLESDNEPDLGDISECGKDDDDDDDTNYYEEPSDAISQISHNPEEDMGMGVLPRLRQGGYNDLVRPPPPTADTRRQFSFSSVFSGRNGHATSPGQDQGQVHGHGRVRLVHVGRGGRGGELTEEERLGLVSRGAM